MTNSLTSWWNVQLTRMVFSLYSTLCPRSCKLYGSDILIKSNCRMGISSAVTRLKEVFKDHQELNLGFGTFLSSDYNKTTLQRKKEKPVTIIKAYSFAKKVKVKIYTTFSYVLINTCFCSTFIFFYVSLLNFFLFLFARQGLRAMMFMYIKHFYTI